MKSVIEDLPGLGFRTMVDPEGDLATHLVVTFPAADVAAKVADELGSITLDKSGWHVYSNMEHLLERTDRQRQGLPVRLCVLRHGAVTYRRGMLPADRCAARALDEHRHRRVRHEPGAVRAPDADDEAAARRIAERFCDVAGTYLAG